MSVPQLAVPQPQQPTSQENKEHNSGTSDTTPSTPTGTLSSSNSNNNLSFHDTRLNELPILMPHLKKSSIYGKWKAAQDVRIVLEDTGLKDVVVPLFPNSKVNEIIMTVN